METVQYCLCGYKKVNMEHEGAQWLRTMAVFPEIQVTISISKEGLTILCNTWTKESPVFPEFVSTACMWCTDIQPGKYSNT